MKSHLILSPKAFSGALFFFLVLLCLIPAKTVCEIRLSLEEGFSRVYAGEKQRLRVETSGTLFLPENLIFSSLDPSIAEIDPKGLLTPLRPGTVTITAKAEKDGLSAADELTIRVLPEPDLSVRFCSKTLTRGTRCTMNTDECLPISVSWLGEHTPRFFSSDPSVAQVSSDGTIRALKPGNTRIKIISNRSGRYVLQEQIFTFRIKVLPWLEETDETDLICYLNAAHIRDTADLLSRLQVHGASAEDVRFKVKNPSLGQVENGIYIPKNDGKNTVTAVLGPSKIRFTIVSLRWLAHRGFSDQYPENTKEAFIGAAKAGAFAIETDLQLTADAQWICFHDFYTACLMDTPEDDRIDDHTLEELKTDPSFIIRTGNNLEVFGNDPPKIASLSEYLDICSLYNVCACLELKGPLPDRPEVSDALQTLWEEILDHDLADRFILFSLDPETADAFEKANASAPLIREDYPLGAYTCCSFRGDASMPTTLRMVSSEYDLITGRKNLPWTEYHTLTPLYHPGLF